MHVSERGSAEQAGEAVAVALLLRRRRRARHLEHVRRQVGAELRRAHPAALDSLSPRASPLRLAGRSASLVVFAPPAMRGHVVLCAMVLINAAPCTLAQDSPASQALMSNHGHDDRKLVAALARLHLRGRRPPGTVQGCAREPWTRASAPPARPSPDPSRHPWVVLSWVLLGVHPPPLSAAFSAV